jgi:uncharacterized protein (DUF58 family)
MLLVDTLAERRTLDELALVERAIAMAASLADAALEQGLSVGLCAWSGNWLVIPPTRGKRHKAEVLSILAGLPLNESHVLKEMAAQARRALGNGTTPILFTPHDQTLRFEEVRGGAIAVPADSQRGRAWFKFDPVVDFIACMPTAHQPASGAVS